MGGVGEDLSLYWIQNPQMTGTVRDALSVKSSMFDLKFFSWWKVKTCVFGSLLDQ
jgi:hypothetical protein